MFFSETLFTAGLTFRAVNCSGPRGAQIVEQVRMKLSRPQWASTRPLNDVENLPGIIAICAAAKPTVDGSSTGTYAGQADACEGRRMCTEKRCARNALSMWRL